MDFQRVEWLPNEPTNDAVYEITPNKGIVVGNSHRFFNKYPARFIPQVPKWAITKYSESKHSIVLDPFSGSGTTLVEGMLHGCSGFAVDVDPFARLLTKVKTTVFSDDQVAQMDNYVRLILQRAASDHVPNIEPPSIPNLSKWFSEQSTLDLMKLKEGIFEIAGEAEQIRDFLLIVMAGILRKVSNAENGSPKPYISTRFPKQPEPVLPLFVKTYEAYAAALRTFSEQVRTTAQEHELPCLPSVHVAGNDARDFTVPEAVGLAVTSPPYINAVDYVRVLKFENMWLGLASNDELLDVRRQHVGTESLGVGARQVINDELTDIPAVTGLVGDLRQTDPVRAAIVTAFFRDMRRNLQAVHRNLQDDGVYVIVVGDSTIRGITIPTADLLGCIGEDIGFKREISFKYVIRDRYLHIPRGGQGGMIELDTVLVLRK